MIFRYRFRIDFSFFVVVVKQDCGIHVQLAALIRPIASNAAAL
ncbi:hypothetical protein SynRS9907_01667 [Synechococcus sp. RS9907]|nr:hypothetical protein SynRS9907_01667 [Synechococcus sp. RS9907]